MGNERIVDEVEANEKPAIIALLSKVLNLCYAELIVHPIEIECILHCRGCKTHHPSQKEHNCLMMDEEEKWNLYYDRAKVHGDPDLIWETAHGVCHLWNIPLHKSWKKFVMNRQRVSGTAMDRQCQGQPWIKKEWHTYRGDNYAII